MTHPDKSVGDIPIELHLPQISIRKMTDTDINPYCSLFQNVFSKSPWNEKWDINKIDADIRKLLRKESFFGMVAETGSRGVGYLTGFRLKVIQSLFFIDQLFIDTDHQGKKIGPRLLSETTSHIKNLGVSRILLLTKPHTIAEKFYRVNGYKQFLSVISFKDKTFFIKTLDRLK